MVTPATDGVLHSTIVQLIALFGNGILTSKHSNVGDGGGVIGGIIGGIPSAIIHPKLKMSLCYLLYISYLLLLLYHLIVSQW